MDEMMAKAARPKSKDFAGDIAELIQDGMAGDLDSQAAVAKLYKKAQEGDQRLQALLQDAGSRIKDKRHVSPEARGDEIWAGLSELHGEGVEAEDPEAPSPREQQLLQIIANLSHQLRMRDRGAAPQGAPA